MEITIRGTFDPGDILRDALDTLDLTGLGPHETTEYEVASSSVDADPLDVTITLTIDRVEGMNASRDSVQEHVEQALQEIDGWSSAE